MSYNRGIDFDPKREFAERLGRIQAGGINTNRTLFVGMEEQLALPPGTFVRKKKKTGAWVRTGFLLMIAGSTAGIMAAMSGVML
ncbi:MAG: hypothetical protein R3D90_06970 [Paracoccaceae bacterium]